MQPYILQEHYLPHLMRAKLKLACSDVEDTNFTDFLNRSLGDADRKALLETRHSTELALYSIIRGDLDRAKYYNDQSLQMFLQVYTGYGAQCAYTVTKNFPFFLFFFLCEN